MSNRPNGRNMYSEFEYIHVCNVFNFDTYYI